MNPSEAVVSRRGGLLNVADIIIAPAAAFMRLRAAAAWGWAFLAAALLGIAGMLLAQPAFLHALDVSGPAQYAAMPAVSKLPAEKQAAAIAQMVQIGHLSVQFQWLAIPLGLLVGSLLSAVLMLIANAIAKGDGTFKKFYALAMTVSVVSVGIGTLLLGIITVLRGPASFDSTVAVARVIPSFALVAPMAPPKIQALLASFSITTLWATALQAFGMIAVARISPLVAWTFSIVFLVLSAALAASFTP